MEFGEHRVETHARETDLSVVYTIDPAVVDDYINSVEQLLARDKYKVVGIDLQYTGGHPSKIRRLSSPSCACAIMSSSTTTAWPQSLATVSTGLSTAPSDDVNALGVTACKNLVEIRDHYRVWGSTKKDSLVELASAIIDPYYEKMKQDYQRPSPVSRHRAWMRQLDEPHLRFAAKSVYTCYEMHRRIVDMRKCLVTQIDELGSSHKQSKRHKK